MIKELIFEFLAALGILIISILAFIIPADPYMIIPSHSLIGFDKPLWFTIIIVGGFFYIMILCAIYNYLEEKI